MSWLTYLFGVMIIVIVSLTGWRVLDRRADQAAWERLTAKVSEKTTFKASMTAGLPEPAQRYFHFTIAQGTPLHTAVEMIDAAVGHGA